MYIYKGFQIPEYKDARWDIPLEPFMKSTIDHLVDQEALFEYVYKNIKSYNNVINYTGNNITSIVYDLGSGNSITKTFNYDINNNITSIVLSGNLPASMTKTTKTLTYINNNVSTITYSWGFY